MQEEEKQSFVRIAKQRWMNTERNVELMHLLDERRKT